MLNFVLLTFLDRLWRHLRERYIIIPILFAGLLTGCIDFSTYSDSNDVLAVYIGGVSSDNIIINKQEIVSGSEGRVVLTLKGRLEDDMPLTVGAEFELSSHAKILYQEKYHEFVFHSLQDSFSFQVIAQSGLPKKWTLKLQDGRSGAANIEKFRIASYKAAHEISDLVQESATLRKGSDTSRVEVFVNTRVDTVFPIEIVPDITLAENGHFVDYESGTALRFDSPLSTHCIKIEAENKKVICWKISLRSPDSEEVNLQGGSFLMFTDCLETTDTVFAVDTAEANAIVRIKDVFDWTNFSALLQYRLKLPLGAKMVILDGDNSLFNAQKAVFNTIQDIRKFKIVSQSGKEKIWKIKLDYKYNRTAKIENFSYASYQPENLVNISLDPLCVDELTSRIYVNVNSGVKNISDKNPLVILPVLRLSDKASVEGVIPDKGVYRLPPASFKKMDDVYRFKIYSESMEPRDWEIVLVNKQKDKDREAEIKSVMIHQDKVPSGVVFAGDVFTPVSGSSEVKLQLNTAKFPFVLEAGAFAVNISDKAQILNGLSLLTFESAADRKTVRVEAENGDVKVWTIRLEYKQAVNANIRELRISQLFPDAVVFEKNAVVDSAAGKVTVNVTDAGSYFPLRLDVAFILSDRARIEPDIKSLVFRNVGEVLKVNVVSESGYNREWSIVLNNQVNKSDKAVIESLGAESLNAGIKIGVAKIDGGAVQIPVLSGRRNFPLSLDISKTVISTGAKISKSILIFDGISKSDLFTVTSQSGNVSKNYTVSLLDQIPLSDSANIKAVNLNRYSPLDYQLSGQIDIQGNEALIEVYRELTTPLTVWPVLTLSDGAKLESALPGNGIELTAGGKYAVTVVAENKSKKVWYIGTKVMPRPKNSEALIEQVEVSNSAGIVLEPVLKANNEVVLYMNQATPVYPFTVQASLSVSPNATVQALQSDGTSQKNFRMVRSGVEVLREVPLTFKTAGDKPKVRITSEDAQTTNEYTFGLGGVKGKSNEANVTEYSIQSYFPMNMPEAPIVFAPDTAAGIITVNAPSEDAFPFTIYTKMRLSYGASLKGLDASKMVFERGFSGQNFQVISESGRVKNWELRMKVAEKSKENNVLAFEIKNYTPHSAGLGVPQIKTAERKIVIPVANWKKGERLDIEIKPLTISPKAETDCRTSLFFQTAKDEYTFKVKAQNGDEAQWTVVLDYTFSREAEITMFDVLSGDPASVLYNRKAIIDSRTRTVQIEVLENLTFPFTVTANIISSLKSEMDLTAIPGNRIRFDKYQDSTMIRVTAEDETVKKDWKVRLKYNFSEAAEITRFQITAHQPESVILGNPAVEIVPTERVVYVDIADWGGQTTLKVAPVVEISDKAVHNLTGELLFVKKSSETKQVKVTAEDGTVVTWTVKLRYKESSAADITEFKYASAEPANIDFLGATINAKDATVTLELQTWNGATVFSLKGITYKISDKATANLPSELTFYKLTQESISHVVTAQDGTQKKWTFKLLYHESSAAEITRFRITGNNRPGIISMAQTGIIGDGTIDIELNSGVRDAFASGFQINVEVLASTKATHNIPDVILFSSASSTKKYTVTAESGATKEWTIRFINKASSEANLLAVRGATIAGNPSPDLKITDLKLSGNTITAVVTDVITKNKYDSKWPTLAIDMDLQLSAKAAVTEGTQVIMKVDDMQRRTLTVVADNGINQNIYDVVFAYQPQLDNWDMDTWSSNTVPGGSNTVWATANTSTMGVTVTGTVQGTGVSGSAAVMTTSMAPVVNKIASGTVFTGKFVMGSISDATSDPEKLTHFGVPFPVKPRQIQVTIQYRIGNGTDKAHIWAAAEYWPNPNSSTHPNRNPENKRCAYGEKVITENLTGWTTITIDLVANPEFANLKPTHILFVAASSKEGNQFIGAKGSELRVDNVRLVY